jgi:hypothetical protein
MAKEWKEWYVGKGDQQYKICRGTYNGMPDVELLHQQEDGTYRRVIRAVFEAAADADVVAERLVREYDTEKVFSKSTRVGKGKGNTYH